MIRVAVPAIDPSGGAIELPEAEAHHLRVRRIATGEAIEALDGRGRVASGTVVAAGKRYLVEVTAVRAEPAPPPRRILVGAGDRDRFAWLVEKATELGATEIVPLVTERSVGVATGVAKSHGEKLERRALEALKQSGGSWAPLIRAPIDLATAIDGTETAIRWLADAGGEHPPTAPAGAGASVIIGPEGGLTPGERDVARRGGFVSVALGTQVLRFETAAIAALALLVARKD